MKGLVVKIRGLLRISGNRPLELFRAAAHRFRKLHILEGAGYQLSYWHLQLPSHHEEEFNRSDCRICAAELLALVRQYALQMDIQSHASCLPWSPMILFHLQHRGRSSTVFHQLSPALHARPCADEWEFVPEPRWGPVDDESCGRKSRGM